MALPTQGPEGGINEVGRPLNKWFSSLLDDVIGRVDSLENFQTSELLFLSLLFGTRNVQIITGFSKDAWLLLCPTYTVLPTKIKTGGARGRYIVICLVSLLPSPTQGVWSEGRSHCPHPSPHLQSLGQSGDLAWNPIGSSHRRYGKGSTRISAGTVKSKKTNWVKSLRNRI